MYVTLQWVYWEEEEDEVKKEQRMKQYKEQKDMNENLNQPRSHSMGEWLNRL